MNRLIDENDARQGVTLGVMRYVLGISVVLTAIILPITAALLS